MKNFNALPTENLSWGFWGTSDRNGYDAEMTWNATSQFLAERFELTPEQVRTVLDSRFGRQLADDLSFIESGPTSAEVIINHFTARVASRSWLDCFEQAIEENTGKTFPKAAPTQDDLLTKIAQKHLKVETLVRRNRDSLDFHDVSVSGIKAALEAAYEAGRKAGK